MKYDLIVVGGGMVGASLAAALNNKALSIALIDANPHTLLDDPRLIALTHHSCSFLKNLNIWPMLQPHATPIKQVHVSHRGRFGITRIRAEEVQRESLGHLIPAKYINIALEEELKNFKQIEIIRPATLEHLTQTNDEVTLTIQTKAGIKTLTANKVIGADGTHSTVRKLLSIPVKTVDYNQSAIVTVTELQRAHQHIAYERFLDQGAIAMLPLSENKCATIWTDHNATVSHLMKLSDTDFLNTLQKEFGYRLGRLQKIEKRHTYPLKLILSEENHKNNILLIGNAAHTLHPIASQGLNLALYEIAELIDHIQNHTHDQWNFNDIPRKTHLQQKISMQLSHQLPRLFSTDFFMLNIARQLGMVGLDSCKIAKEFFIRNTTMGRTGKTPSLLQEKEVYATELNGH